MVVVMLMTILRTGMVGIWMINEVMTMVVTIVSVVLLMVMMSIMVTCLLDIKPGPGFLLLP